MIVNARRFSIEGGELPGPIGAEDVTGLLIHAEVFGVAGVDIATLGGSARCLRATGRTDGLDAQQAALERAA